MSSSGGTFAPAAAGARAGPLIGRRSSPASRSALRSKAWAETRLPPAARPPSSPSSTNWNRRARVIGCMSPPRSIIAPWPAKMEWLLSPGATTARVTPAARLMPIAIACGLTAGAMSSAALNGEAEAEMSFEAPAASTSDRPIREKPATTPGVTHLPCASTIVAPAGTATLAPAATTRPSRITTMPLSIGSLPSPITTRPPTKAVVWAVAGTAARKAAQANRTVRVERSRDTQPSAAEAMLLFRSSAADALFSLRSKGSLDFARDERRVRARSAEPLAKADHFVSPSPGWPSSKSLTGRRCGSRMSYMSAPSIQTCCGRV